MAAWSGLTWFAIICGVAALLLFVLFFRLKRGLQRKALKAAKQKKKLKQEKEAALEQQQLNQGISRRLDASDAEGKSSSEKAAAPLKPICRGEDVIRKEQELKRDTLHIFRRLQASSDAEEKASLCLEAVTLFDKIGDRCGTSAASSTSGKIVFCNALMECGGLDELRNCQDSNDPNAQALFERVVPIIFST
mmetsp:Transcript_77125/g.121795  ORF Transcript_77125/g.121795 Transcript_77125/m.121795 type:complete len:192 (-) Transcript_77125:12-587(-)